MLLKYQNRGGLALAPKNRSTLAFLPREDRFDNVGLEHSDILSFTEKISIDRLSLFD